jgi:hypothetical protein
MYAIKGIIIPWSVVQIRPPLPSKTSGNLRSSDRTAARFLSQCVAPNTNDFQRFAVAPDESVRHGRDMIDTAE